jgi:hypothetical protein
LIFAVADARVIERLARATNSAARAPRRASPDRVPSARNAASALARRDAAERERVRQRLAGVGETAPRRPLHAGQSRGSSRPLKATSAESTFGAAEHLARTGCQPVRSVASWRSTENGDRTPSCAAARRSDRDFALQHHAPRFDVGLGRQLSATIGVADVVGEVRDEFARRPGSSAARSSASASPQCSRTLSASGRYGSSARSISTAWHDCDSLGEESREDAAAGADLEHDVGGES